jgi:ankyrin repeat protein
MNYNIEIDDIDHENDEIFRNYTLFVAVKKGLVETVSKLLQWQGPNGEFINPDVDYYGEGKPIINAITNGSNEIVNMLLDWRSPNGSYIDPTENDNLTIFKAIEYGHIDIVRLLLNWRSPNGDYIDITIYNDDLELPIHLAKNYGHNEIIELLEMNINSNLLENMYLS